MVARVKIGRAGVRAGGKQVAKAHVLRRRAAAVTAFELPFPPSLNHYWRSTARGVLISAAGREYREAVLEAVARQDALAAPPGRLCVELDAYPPGRQRRDIDNLPKSLLDSLVAAGIYEDDSLIDRLVITRGPCVRGGLVRVRITRWEGG